MEELQGILERFAGSGWELIALPSRRWLDGQENREELVRALQQAQQICGNCGCDLDSLYPKALRLLEIV